MSRISLVILLIGLISFIDSERSEIIYITNNLLQKLSEIVFEIIFVQLY